MPRSAGSDRPRSDKPRTAGSDRPRNDRPRSDRQNREQSPMERGPADPHIDDDVLAEELDPSILNELRTLPEGLAEIVARHLVAADRALANDDTETARAHALAAKRRAGRVAAVREAAGVTAYLVGDFAEALAELRTVRRMSGGEEYLPLMADCERGLGRPQKAVDLIREVDLRSVDEDLRVELLLVLAGARADMGQVDAAIVVLKVPELTKLPKGDARARLQYAYSMVLREAGRVSEADEWLVKAAESDTNAVTDAADELEENIALGEE